MTFCEKKIVAENRDINSKLQKNRWFRFFPDTCRPSPCSTRLRHVTSLTVERGGQTKPPHWLRDRGQVGLNVIIRSSQPKPLHDSKMKQPDDYSLEMISAEISSLISIYV